MSILQLKQVNSSFKKHVKFNPFSFKAHKKLVLHTADCIRILPLDQIEFIQGSSNYSIIFLVDGSKLIASKTMKEIQMQLDNSFIRTHKSFIVNLNYVTHYHMNSAQIILESEKKINVSRGNKAMMKDVFKIT